MSRIQPYLKAVTGAVVAGLTAAGAALGDGHISPADGVGIAAAFFVAFGAVWAVPNTPAS